MSSPPRFVLIWIFSPGTCVLKVRGPSFLFLLCLPETKLMQAIDFPPPRFVSLEHIHVSRPMPCRMRIAEFASPKCHIPISNPWTMNHPGYLVINVCFDVSFRAPNSEQSESADPRGTENWDPTVAIFGPSNLSQMTLEQVVEGRCPSCSRLYVRRSMYIHFDLRIVLILYQHFSGPFCAESVGSCGLDYEAVIRLIFY